ncbi:hypothetical protein [Micromonospora sp. NPDC049497]|uniref:hypothetical protein n=1 Tax=Micromonospora sp. NPDC049497 TaxID=3364273 RepID=UPI003789A792
MWSTRAAAGMSTTSSASGAAYAIDGRADDDAPKAISGGGGPARRFPGDSGVRDD